MMRKPNPEQLIEEKWRRFGLWIVDKRTHRGWTQEFCAERAGMKRQQWGRLEKGAPTKEITVMRVADALEADRVEALSIIKSSVPATAPPERAEEAARVAEIIENWMTLSPDRQAQALEFLRFLKGQEPDRDAERLKNSPAVPQDDDIRQTYEEFEAEIGGPAVKRIPSNEHVPKVSRPHTRGGEPVKKKAK